MKVPTEEGVCCLCGAKMTSATRVMLWAKGSLLFLVKLVILILDV